MYISEKMDCPNCYRRILKTEVYCPYCGCNIKDTEAENEKLLHDFIEIKRLLSGYNINNKNENAKLFSSYSGKHKIAKSLLIHGIVSIPFVGFWVLFFDLTVSANLFTKILLHIPLLIAIVVIVLGIVNIVKSNKMLKRIKIYNQFKDVHRAIIHKYNERLFGKFYTDVKNDNLPSSNRKSN